MILSRRQFFLCCFIVIFVVTNGQVTLNVEVAERCYEEDDDVVVSCTYTYDPSTFFVSVDWFFEKSVAVASYDGSKVTYPSPGYSPPTYSLTSGDFQNGSNLTILKANVSNDGNYTCRVTVFTSDTVSDEKDGDVNIYVYPNASTYQGIIDGSNIDFGGKFNMTAGEEINMTLIVPGIFPEAMFEWKLGEEKQMDTTTKTMDQDGLFTSTSTATLKPGAEYSGQQPQVTCLVTNGGCKPASLVDIAQLYVEGGQAGGGCALARLDPRLVVVSLAWIVANQVAAHFF